MLLRKGSAFADGTVRLEKYGAYGCVRVEDINTHISEQKDIGLLAILPHLGIDTQSSPYRKKIKVVV